MSDPPKICRLCVHWSGQHGEWPDDHVDPTEDVALGRRPSMDGYCQRYPPARNRQGSSEWPRTQKDDWCGEWSFFDAERLKAKSNAFSEYLRNQHMDLVLKGMREGKKYREKIFGK